LTIASAITKPALGSTTNPLMDITVQAVSSSAGSLRYTFSDNGFGPASGTLTATMTGQVISGAPSTVGYDVYGDPANVLGATTVHLASTGTSPLPAMVSGSGLLTLGAPYSLTQVVQLNASGASDISVDASFNVIPEPSTIGLVAVGLLGALTIRRRKA
jgi:PEP-CTERM motif